MVLSIASTTILGRRCPHVTRRLRFCSVLLLSHGDSSFVVFGCGRPGNSGLVLVGGGGGPGIIIVEQLAFLTFQVTFFTVGLVLAKEEIAESV
jgi:hypothetical protein